MPSAKDDTRATVLKMIREGRDSQEISKKTGLSLWSIRAYRAHDTMGKYEPLSTDEAEEIEEAIQTTFGLERDLQQALRANISQLELGLVIADGGKERQVPSGRIDITAKDRYGWTVAIELKVGKADRDAVAQVLSYIGDLGDSTRGIIVAGDFAPNALSAARAAHHIELKRYRHHFTFVSAGEDKEQSSEPSRARSKKTPKPVSVRRTRSGSRNSPAKPHILRLLADKGAHSRESSVERNWLDDQLIGKVDGVKTGAAVSFGLIDLKAEGKIAYEGKNPIKKVWLVRVADDSMRAE